MAHAVMVVPTIAIQKPAHATLGHLSGRSSARVVKATPRPMMKNVVNTMAMSTPCAVTDR
jgi:hypothetical protein